MHSENFKANFLKMASTTHAKQKHIASTFIYFLVETRFKYQNNKQNLQYLRQADISDCQILS